MITAANITDEQIRELREDERRATTHPRDVHGRAVEECNLALNLPAGFDRDQWRAHCARILNARAASKAGS